MAWRVMVKGDRHVEPGPEVAVKFRVFSGVWPAQPAPSRCLRAVVVHNDLQLAPRISPGSLAEDFRDGSAGTSREKRYVKGGADASMWLTANGRTFSAWAKPAMWSPGTTSSRHGNAAHCRRVTSSNGSSAPM